MKFTYNGEDERVFPTISLTVAPGDTFDAPDDFVAPDVVPSGTAVISNKVSDVAMETPIVVESATPAVDNTLEPTPTVGE